MGSSLKNRKNNRDLFFKQLDKCKIMHMSEILRYLANRVTLFRMVQKGEIYPAGPAIYAHNSLDPFAASVIAASKYYPKCIVSNLTALVIHDLSNERIDKVDVDLNRDTSIRNKFLSVHRVPKYRLIGITRLDFHGFSLRIYDKERSLCDAYLFDPGGPIFFKALKQYVAQGFPDTEKIGKYDKILKTNVLSHIRQEIADG
jgi:hypothetical protein